MEWLRETVARSERAHILRDALLYPAAGGARRLDPGGALCLGQKVIGKLATKLIRPLARGFDEGDAQLAPAVLGEAGVAREAEAGRKQVLEDVDGVGVEFGVEGQQLVNWVVRHGGVPAPSVQVLNYFTKRAEYLTGNLSPVLFALEVAATLGMQHIVAVASDGLHGCAEVGLLSCGQLDQVG